MVLNPFKYVVKGDQMDCIPGKRIIFSSKSNQLCNWWDSPSASNYLFLWSINYHYKVQVCSILHA